MAKILPAMTTPLDADHAEAIVYSTTRKWMSSGETMIEQAHRC